MGGDVALDYAAHHWREMAAGIPMEGLSRSPTFPSPAGVTHPSWGPGWQGIALAEAGGDQIAQPQLLGGKDCGAALAASRAAGQRGGRPGGVATHDVRGLLGAVECPMLVVCGEDDFWVPKPLVEETVKLLKNAEVAYLKGIGHYPDVETVANCKTGY